ncbi:12-oxophytodienoate reductase 1 [Colletotrichum tofieldiae]|uniref:12-oxophytodienoate reductase 1 n=1 Tax=Colletotrichum tofieldiae TaxID=708197 RepID=A0A166Y998_9PEZI|nr:12-oxophytodienoate reductase 1 [Colletotrichum tofieldiae]
MPKATTPPPAFAALKDTALFAPLKLGGLSLKHRIVQAPTTRMRSEFESRGIHVPGTRVSKYYSERASAGGLQISEATDICLDASAYPGVAGVFTDSQLQGWRKVTDAVHSQGGFIFVQLWHTGRASSAGMRGGATPISSSSLPMDGKYLDGTDCKDGPPRPMTVGEIHDLTREWAAASKRAVEVAGFDGVEIHGANGYLIEQFLHDNINDRTDEYGGSIENRSRFLFEVLSAVSGAIGPEKVGLRLSPYNYFQGTRDSDPNKHWSYICQKIAELPETQRPVYVHMIEPRFDEVLDEEQKLASLPGSTPEAKQINNLTQFRDILKPAGIRFFAAGNFDRDNAVSKIKSGDSDAVVFGRYFIANPDLVERFRNGWTLNPYDRSTFYGAEPPEKGYNDYQFYKVDNSEIETRV